VNFLLENHLNAIKWTLFLYILVFLVLPVDLILLILFSLDKKHFIVLHKFIFWGILIEGFLYIIILGVWFWFPLLSWITF